MAAADSVATLTRFGRALRAEGLAGRPRSRRRVLPRGGARFRPRTSTGRAARRSSARPSRSPSTTRVFGEFFGPPRALQARSRSRAAVEVDRPSRTSALRERGRARSGRRASRSCTPDELAQLAELMARIGLAVPAPPHAPPAGGPRRASPTCAGRCGARSAPAASRSTAPGGAAERRPRRLVLLLDVSGSMAAYSRALVMFAHARAARPTGAGRPSASARDSRA